ncbi:MAG: CZB domain-containing protein [Mangrovicoccus sp.]
MQMDPKDIRRKIREAVKEHDAWKEKFASTVETDPQSLKSATIARDDCCGFGRFLHQTDFPDWVVDRKPYEVITRLHKDFHAQAAQAAELAQSGRLAEARRLIAGPCEAASDKLRRALRKWDGELSELWGRRLADHDPNAPPRP